MCWRQPLLEYGDPVITDETLEQFDPDSIAAGDVVGIGIHTGNALRGYEVGRLARDRGAWVVYGGIHATLYPEEAIGLGGGHAVVKGDGDIAWGLAIDGCLNGAARQDLRWREDRRRAVSEGTMGSAAGRSVHVGVGADRARLPEALLVLLGLENRRTGTAAAQRRRRAAGNRRTAPARVPVHRARRRQLLSRHARRSRAGLAPRRPRRLDELKALRAERFELMERLAKLPSDMNFFTQITMEAAEDPDFLDAMRKARIKGALVGVESVTAEGLKDVYKGFNLYGDALVTAAAAVQGARRPRARIVYFRPAQRSRRTPSTRPPRWR